jgi:glutamate 5-kinase
MGRICHGLADLKRRGVDVILVSSGAIRSGRAVMKGCSREAEMSHLQALAAVGQVLLMEAYKKILAGEGYNIAQILLTWDDFKDRGRLRNLVNTLGTLLSLGVLPIINENDTTAVDEIRFGDNDTLSALVGVHMGADLVVILSDVDGLFSGDPRKAGSEVLSCVEAVTPEVERLANEAFEGSGGMASKLKAAKLAADAGIPLVVANSRRRGVLEGIISGEAIGTIFIPRDAEDER